MEARPYPRLVIGLTLSALALTGCSSEEATREAAGTNSESSWPLCSDGFAPECVISIPSNETIVVNNGSTVIFADQNEPVKELSAQEICWSGVDIDDPLTCVDDETQLPKNVDIRRLTLASEGKSWPALAINVLRTPDTSGELYMPLPATLELSIAGASGENTTNIEVACCDEPGRVTTQ